MVDAHYRLVTEGLGIKHLRLVIGNSMGGMHTWLWGGNIRTSWTRGADGRAADRDGGRNWMLRRMMLETIRNDPDYNGGNYTTQPRMMKYAITPLASRPRRHARLSDAGADRAQADKMVDEHLALPMTADANDYIYSGKRRMITIPRRARKDPGDAACDQCRRRRAQPAGDRRDRGGDEAGQERAPFLIPATTETRGHLTTGNAKFYMQQLQELLQTAPQKTM